MQDPHFNVGNRDQALNTSTALCSMYNDITSKELVPSCKYTEINVACIMILLLKNLCHHVSILKLTMQNTEAVCGFDRNVAQLFSESSLQCAVKHLYPQGQLFVIIICFYCADITNDYNAQI